MRTTGELPLLSYLCHRTDPAFRVFLNGKQHVDFRRMLNNLFTRKALAGYLEAQDRVARKHLSRWLAAAAKSSQPTDLMTIVRHMNMDTSLRVFCGEHIAEESVYIISDNYWKITKALELVNFPLALPGTKIHGAVQCRKQAMAILEDACAKSRAHILAGGDIGCLLDEWHRSIQDAIVKAVESGKPQKDFNDREMALAVLSFLFASQDAMSSSVIYAFQHLGDRPEMLAKIREEQDRVRGGDYNKPCSMEMIDEMKYMNAFLKESMRLKPPVTMVRHHVPFDALLLTERCAGPVHDPEAIPPYV